MASAQVLVPDERILSAIFSEKIDIKPEKCNIISNTFDTCTFSIHCDTQLPGYTQNLLVRLETSQRHLATVTMLQRLAYHQLPDLVPLPLDVGFAPSKDGREVAYSVTPYLDQTVTLEEVWDTLDQAEQRSFMESVVCSMEKLQSLDRESNKALKIVEETVLGLKDHRDDSSWSVSAFAKSLGLHCSLDIQQFLREILLANGTKAPNCAIIENLGGIVVQSTFDDIGSVHLTSMDLESLQQNVVFCHNDLEPQNLLVKRAESGGHELAAIIDWEMARFCPFAYVYACKDTFLGSSNLSFQWYSLFKRHAARLLPQGECHAKMITAIHIIDESKKRSMTRNVGVCFQAEWITREKVEMSEDVRRGWVREEGVGVIPPFTKEDKEQLELKVLKELGLV